MGESIGTYTPIEDLKEWDNNPRHNDHAVDEVAKSIKRFGFASPIIARKEDNMVIAGHTRLAAARSLGLDTVPVRFVDLDPTEAQLLALADNKIGEIAEWDQDLLSEVLTDLKDEDLSGIGFSDAELEELIQEAQFEPLDNVIEGDLDDEDWDQMPAESVKIAKAGGVYQIGGQQVACGDCVEVMRSLPDNSVDSIVTDPPYGISFMGRSWDTFDKKQFGHAGEEGQNDLKVKKGFNTLPRYQSEGMYAFFLEWSKECLRVLRPGGHLIAFSATRSVHRMASAIEDAGFEIRDQLGWCYYSGFPKSMDISKQIDKMRHSEDQKLKVTKWLNAKIKQSKKTHKEILQHFNFNSGSGQIGHWTALSKGAQPSIPTLDQIDILLEFLSVNEIPEEIDFLIHKLNSEKNKPSPNWEKRQITGQHDQPAAAVVWRNNYDSKSNKEAISKEKRDNPYLKEAQYWEGWGTALKPAYEPCVLARKPIAEKNVASQVLKTGTGAINIDACRFGYGDPCWIGPKDFDGRGTHSRKITSSLINVGAYGQHKDYITKGQKAGRWPANLYQCPKPSRSEREEGLTDLESKAGFEAVNRKEGSAGVDNPRAGAGRTAGEVKNFHPTVKPVNLMRWLVRLVTPVNGLVLEPFLGSGTTGVASSLEGFRSIGIEREPDYADICLQRIKNAEGVDIVEIDGLKIERLEEDVCLDEQS